MKEYLKKLPKEIKDLIQLAGDIAACKGMSAYLVGGFVRDLLLGVKNLDLDIVVEGDGIKFAESFSKVLKARLIRHRRFGTASVILTSNLKIDIATARKESYPEPASLPEVTSGVLKDDLARRDFTINAMAIGISGKTRGELMDFFNGKEDLRRKNVRILHDLSFIDDPMRILRAIRFEKRYNFRIEPNTLSLLKEAASIKMLEKVQPHRLREELILTLKEEHPLKEIKRIQELVGFGFISPGLSASERTYNLFDSIEKQVAWFRKKFPRHRKLDEWLIYFIGLIDSLDTSAIKSIYRSFAFRKGEEKIILSYKKVAPKIMQELIRDKIKPSRIFSLLEPLSYEAIILVSAKSKNRSLRRHIEDFFEIYNGMRLCICGDDLNRLGVAPGPYYQKIFAKVLEAKLNGLVKTEEEELALIKQMIKVK